MRRNEGFTMIELLVTLAIIGMMVAVAAPRYFGNLDRTKEDVLREDLYILRSAIDHYYADKNVYPNELADLVKEKYLRSVPVDPFTQSAHSWHPSAPDDPALGAVADVHSTAPGPARDGTMFTDW
ncbi:type II secretion system protein [Rugamonas apoptosis]|uniref:Prepilin-type N-terminal cleavage/methylation domain-containing protein n=1 Tax=Rugamonas apoptosis TaxID=2758570 RepID=A0A7W2FDY5_9BURK|nr:prepilin-type N-terminal cleavage/methylation domain-containing protein [Rugamonas apoptosis]MBA5689977.1 prepilin-type N-terminal cleavage/methylation domain-containing protein [Rugamonas apoptosis]